MPFDFWVPVMSCLAVLIAAASILCLPYALKSKKTATALNQVAVRLDKQKRCSMQNMTTVHARISRIKNNVLIDIWERYKADSDNLFAGEHAPVPGIYFTYEDVFFLPCRENILTVLRVVFPLFMLLSIASPIMLFFNSGAEMTLDRLKYCLAAAFSGVTLTIVLSIITFILIQSVKQKNARELAKFNLSMEALLPIINQSTQAALFLRASEKNADAFRETAKTIAEKIDAFAVNGITPIVAASFNKSIEKYITPSLQRLEKLFYELSNIIVKRQENGMKELANAFAANLTDSVARQIKAITADMEILNGNIRAFNKETEDNTRSLIDTLLANKKILGETAEISRSIAAHQETAAHNIGDMSAALVKTEQVMSRIETRDQEIFSTLNMNYDRLAGIHVKVDTHLQTVEESSKSMTEIFGEASSVMVSSVQSLISAVNETGVRTYNQISERLNQTLEDIHTVSVSASQAINDSVNALIVQTTEAGENTHRMISDKLIEALAKTDEAHINTSQSIRETAKLLVDETGKTVDSRFDLITARLSALFTDTNASNNAAFERISQSVETLAATVGGTVQDVFNRNSTGLMEALGETVRTNKDTSQRLSSTVELLSQAGTEQYEKAAHAAAQLLENVVIEMNKAMDGVGHEIADSIREASIGSADIVNRLAEKTNQLKNEYDAYFGRVETQSLTNLTEVEYRVQSVFARFSNDATGIMDRLEGNISKAVGLFEGNTTMLLQSLEEQSRSIGLYAKDLNIDVASLSDSLRESVGIFSEHLQSSTHKTFAEFDEGLAEVSARLANTVESIRESIENLPNILQLKQ